MTKLLMPYITAGVRPNWATYLTAFGDAGADLIEVGLPFSDPTVDGPTIQEASDAALTRGATPASVLAELATIRVSIPLVASTYANIALRPGFAGALRAAGVTGLIVPDLPLDELAGLSVPGIEVSLLASPATPDDRLAEIGRRSQGFVYAVSVMGTTGERDQLAPSAAALAARVKQVTDLPVLLGFGISTPEQAAEAAAVADGVIVGAAIMRRILDGDSPAEVGLFVASLRDALSGADRRAMIIGGDNQGARPGGRSGPTGEEQGAAWHATGPSPPTLPRRSVTVTTPPARRCPPNAS